MTSTGVPDDFWMLFPYQVFGSGLVLSAETGQKIYVLIYRFNKAMFCPNYTQQQKQGRGDETHQRINLPLFIKSDNIYTTLVRSRDWLLLVLDRALLEYFSFLLPMPKYII